MTSLAIKGGTVVSARRSERADLASTTGRCSMWETSALTGER